MNSTMKNVSLFVGVTILFGIAGFLPSWNVSLDMLVVGLISAVSALGVNMQWGYAGLFNVGVMGFSALGGLAMVLVATPLRPAAWAAGGWLIPIGLAIGDPSPPGGTDGRDLLARADHALLAAKAEGRNQVTIDRPAA